MNDHLPVTFTTTQSEATVVFEKIDSDTSFFVVDYTTKIPCGG